MENRKHDVFSAGQIAAEYVFVLPKVDYVLIKTSLFLKPLFLCEADVF